MSCCCRGGSKMLSSVIRMPTNLMIPTSLHSLVIWCLACHAGNFGDKLPQFYVSFAIRYWQLILHTASSCYGYDYRPQEMTDCDYMTGPAVTVAAWDHYNILSSFHASFCAITLGFLLLVLISVTLTVLGVIACQLHENQIDSAAGQLEFLHEVNDSIGKIPVS